MKLLILSLFLSLAAFGQNLVLDQFVNELSSRQSRVEEFQFIKKIATDLGIKHVYMFGGTAAAWGHYVRWDMRRELGIEKLQSERFDYDYTNIFRANQDFDVVVDGTLEQAKALELSVQKQFNYFSGPRPTWEVRLLNEQRADKDPIMGADFQNQHTDSHSTGLIEMMDCKGFDCIKDVRDIENNHSAFLMDLFEAKLHYYYSEKHRETKRFKAGMNPEILSVIRYFTKAVQYELERRPEDVELIQKMITNFNPTDKKNWDGYVVRWLEKNAKKLIANAIDMEFAQKIIEETGLKQKLIVLSDTNKHESMAWWLNKEALKSFTVGQGDGKKALELFKPNKNGEILVAHETNSFPAFESITRSHDGTANVLISRSGVVGEAAAYGNGHYTRLGTNGARGTGLTIRYKLNPQSREGVDFVIGGDDYIIVKNKKALEVIFENLNLGVADYFERMARGLKFEFNDRGMVEKLNRRISRQLKRVSEKDFKRLIEISNIEDLRNPNIVSLWNNQVVYQYIKQKLKDYPQQSSNIEIIDTGQNIKLRVHLDSFYKQLKKSVKQQLKRERKKKFKYRFNLKRLIGFIAANAGMVALTTSAPFYTYHDYIARGFSHSEALEPTIVFASIMALAFAALPAMSIVHARSFFKDLKSDYHFIYSQKEVLNIIGRKVSEIISGDVYYHASEARENYTNKEFLEAFKGKIDLNDSIFNSYFTVKDGYVDFSLLPDSTRALPLNSYLKEVQKLIERLECSSLYVGDK